MIIFAKTTVRYQLWLISHVPSATAILSYRPRHRFWGSNRQTCLRPILRLKSANLPPPDFETQIGKPSTSDVDACPTSRQVSQRLQDLSRSRCMGRQAAYSNSPSPSSLSWPTLSLSRACTLALPCTTLTARDSVRTHRVPQFKPTRVHPSPSLVHRHEPFAWPSLHLLTATSHPMSAHYEPKDISNPHNVVNHSSSKGDHHWSSISSLMSALTTSNTNSSYRTRLKEEEWKRSSSNRSKSQMKRQAQDLSKWEVSVPKDKSNDSTQLRQKHMIPQEKAEKGSTPIMCKSKARIKRRNLKKS